jgi:hypothetical protein
MYAAALRLDGKLGLGFRACLASQGTMKMCIATAKAKAYGSNLMFIAQQHGEFILTLRPNKISVQR